MRAHLAPLLVVAVAVLGACGDDDDVDPATLPSVPTPSLGSRPGGSAPTTGEPTAEIGTGSYLVGGQVAPGTYRTEGPTTASCQWERLRGPSSQEADIIAEAEVAGPAIVEILPTDVAFTSAGCEDWAPLANLTAVESFGDGDWVVGEQVEPGTWSTDGDPNALGCQWERASGFTHADREVIASEDPPVPATVDIEAGDVRFTSDGCGTWTKAP